MADEYAGLIWDERSLKREEHPNCPNDLADANLYAWRLCYSYLSEAVDPPPTVGSAEWYEQEEDDMLQAEIERYREQQEVEAASWGLSVDDYELAKWWHTRRSYPMRSRSPRAKVLGPRSSPSRIHR